MVQTRAVAGYSTRTLTEKLGIRPGMRVVLVGAPEGVIPDVGAGTRLRAGTELIVVFVTRRADLERRWARLTGALVPTGALWVAWPKRASKVATDMTEHVVREIALPTGWVDTKVCAIDDVWSGLRCVLRVSERPPAPAQELPASRG